MDYKNEREAEGRVCFRMHDDVADLIGDGADMERVAEVIADIRRFFVRDGNLESPVKVAGEFGCHFCDYFTDWTQERRLDWGYGVCDLYGSLLHNTDRCDECKRDHKDDGDG